jgi:ABC-2 type transport system permease protein
MTSESTPLPAATPPAAMPPAAPAEPVKRQPVSDGAIPSRRERSVPHAGWMVVSGKEFADHLWSARFVALIIVLGLAALIPMYFAADTIRAAASQVTGTSSIFLYLSTLAPKVGVVQSSCRARGSPWRSSGRCSGCLRVDAVNGERATGTLPRLLSQPICRYDGINGKFATVLSVIGLVLTLVVLLISAFGIIRLGIVPSPEEILRIVTWLILTFIYVSLWLAFGLLLSVLIRRAATSALVAFGTWLLLTFFGGLITGLIGGFLAPITGTIEQQASNLSLQQTITRLLPDTLYREGSLAILNPQVAAVTNPATIGGYQQAAQRIPSLQSYSESLLLVWPPVVILLALTSGLLALAYVRFMRQEVRASSSDAVGSCREHRSPRARVRSHRRQRVRGRLGRAGSARLPARRAGPDDSLAARRPPWRRRWLRRRPDDPRHRSGRRGRPSRAPGRGCRERRGRRRLAGLCRGRST